MVIIKAFSAPVVWQAEPIGPKKMFDVLAVVHNGSALGFVSAVSAAEDLQETRKLIGVLTSFGSAIGLGVVGLLAFTGGIDQLDAIKVALFQAAWCIFVNLLAKIKSLFI